MADAPNPPQDEQPAEQRIVAATGSAVGHNISDNPSAAEGQEKAMAQAAQECHEQGITDPEEVRGRMMAARDKVLSGS